MRCCTFFFPFPQILLCVTSAFVFDFSHFFAAHRHFFFLSLLTDFSLAFQFFFSTQISFTCILALDPLITLIFPTTCRHLSCCLFTAVVCLLRCLRLRYPHTRLLRCCFRRRLYCYALHLFAALLLTASAISVTY